MYQEYFLPCDIDKLLQCDHSLLPIIPRISELICLAFLQCLQLVQGKIKAEPILNVPFVIPVKLWIIVIHVVRCLSICELCFVLNIGRQFQVRFVSTNKLVILTNIDMKNLSHFVYTFVMARSHSMTSAPCLAASLYASAVCSGYIPLAPRCPMIRGRKVGKPSGP